MTYVIIFGSLIHGAGRSFLKKHLEEFLKSKEYKIRNISVGDILRDIATRENKSISDLVREMIENKEKGYKMDVEIDTKIKQEIERECKRNNYDIILVDANVAPYYPLDCEKIVRILVNTDIDVAAERVYKWPRKGDKKYRSIEEAKKDILERTEIDRKRYLEWAKKIKESSKKELYWLAKAYESYAKGDISVYDILFDNNEDISITLPRLIDTLKFIGILL